MFSFISSNLEGVYYNGSVHYFAFFASLLLFLIAWAYVFRTIRGRDLKGILRKTVGVAASRVARTVVEFRRKSFHLAGLVIPSIYYFGLTYHTKDHQPVLSQAMASWILGCITAFIWLVESLRKINSDFNDFFIRNSGGLLREAERDTFTGTSYYFLGVSSSIILFTPRVAIASILCLVLGDGGAALAGVSFGRIKIAGKKTLTGTLAMFTISFAISMALLWDAQAPEILALIAALSATLAELIPLGIDDNLTIPLLTGLGVTAAAARTGIPIPSF